MTRKTKLILLICLPLIGIVAGYMLMARQVTITVDGDTSQVTTHAMTVRGALSSAGIKLNPLDQVNPPASSWLSPTAAITLVRARVVQVWNDSTGQLLAVTTPADTPAEMLTAVGLLPGADDIVRLNGSVVPLNDPLPIKGSLTLQYTPAVSFTVNRDGTNTTFDTADRSLGLALWDQGIRLHGGDSLNQSITGAVGSQSLIIHSAVPLIITADGRDLSTFIAASTVGEALAAAGVSLQDLDYSKPAETDALPDDGRIIVVRVREEILNENQTIPYNTESTKVDSLDLGEKQVVQQGEFGLQLVRVAIRYEDGVEVSRNNLDTVVLKDPVDQVENVGTKVTAQTVSDTSCGAVQYYRAMDVTTTSYSPCNSDTPNGDCSNTTAIGTPVKHGSLAVFYDWFLILRGTRICIPGYGIGTVEDNGSYPYNHNWIDLGYTDAEYAVLPETEKFHQHITVYFLSPKAAELGQ